MAAFDQDLYLQEASRLDPNQWETKDTEEMQQILANPTMKLIVCKLQHDMNARSARLVNADLRTHEGIQEAVKEQGLISGVNWTLSLLMEAATAEEAEEENG